MLLKKMIVTGFVAMSSISLAHAFSLELQNNTDFPSTSKIGTTCSAMIPGGKGITLPHSHNSIPGFLVKSVCGFTATTCQAEVYMTNNCDAGGATKVADINIDLNTGSIVVSNEQGGYHFTPGIFSVQLDGGPARG
jgi:hypothetical protein